MPDDKEKDAKPEEKKPKAKAKSTKAKSTKAKPKAKPKAKAKAKKEAPPPEPELKGFTIHLKAAGVASVKQWRSLLPDKFWMYGREVGHQTLLAVRSLIDEAADKIDVDDHGSDNPPPPKRKTKKKVEVE